ncbi:MAG: hypothetical protein ACLT2T_05925 [Bilophila wadsworthia]
MRIKEHLYGSKTRCTSGSSSWTPPTWSFVARGTLVCQWATAAGFPTLEIIDGEISAKRTPLRRSTSPAPAGPNASAPRASEPSSTPSTKASWCTTHRAK